MTPEARLDRLERIAKLLIRVGLRTRHESREHDNKINCLIDLQIRNEEKFGNQDRKIGHLIELQEQNEGRFAKLAESQANSDRRLDALIDIIRKDRNGNPTRNT